MLNQLFLKPGNSVNEMNPYKIVIEKLLFKVSLSPYHYNGLNASKRQFRTTIS